MRSLLYVSDMADICKASDVVKIVTEARINNEHWALTGLLIFDGSRFAQWIEGPDNSVQALRRSLEGDNRHRDMDVLVWATHEGPRRFASWRMGYLKYDLDRFGLAGLRGKKDDEAVDAFVFMLPTLDMHIGLAMPEWSVVRAS